MNNHDWLAAQFETHRDHLRGVAYRMLGSLPEADDAVQTAWLNLSSADTSQIANLGGWMTTIVARVCLDMLRARKSRREGPLAAPDALQGSAAEADPEREAQLADSVGLALLIVLDTLTPAERLAFVLHDVFAMPFDEIAPIVGRSSPATRQLVSRARKRVRGVAAVPRAELDRQQEVVRAFLAAARAGDFDALLTVLDPDVVLRSDAVLTASGNPLLVSGAARVARMYQRPGGAQGIQPALVNGVVGLIVAPRGRLMLVINLTFSNGKIIGIEAVAAPERLRQTELGVLDELHP